MKRLYLAAPLFNDIERTFNLRLANILAGFFEVYLPQRDGYLMVDLIRDGFSVEDASKYVFTKDVESIRGSHMILAVLDGRTVDEGVAFEIGFALANGLHCFGLQTDIRRQLPTGNNPMINEALIKIFDTVEDMIKWAAEESEVAEAQHFQIENVNEQEGSIGTIYSSCLPE